MAADPWRNVSLADVPDELLLHVLQFLDIPDLLTLSRTCHRLRALALDPILHIHRRRHTPYTLSWRLSRRPILQNIQPPAAAIYLTRTHLAAKRLHWSLVSIRLNRSLSRRPTLTALVSANVIPRDCCRRDRSSGEIVLRASGHSLLVERKRLVEREQLKSGLRVWMEKKANEIRRRKKDAFGIGVGVLIWRYSRRSSSRPGAALEALPFEVRDRVELEDGPVKGHLSHLRSYWEGMSHGAGPGLCT